MVITKSKFNRNKTTNNVTKSYYFMDIIGLSTDAKPSFFGGNYVEEGSTFLEENTGKVAMMQSDYTWAYLE